MPTYLLTSPDGKKYRVTGEGSGEDALTQLQSQLGGQTQQPEPTQPQQEPQSVSRTALDQGLQGATFGFADEVTDRVGAGIASLATDESYDDLLKEARGNTKERFQQQFEQNPGTAIASNIGGALLTGGAGASTKAGAATTNMLRSGGLGARVAKGAVAGASSGALYGAGSSDEGHRLEGAGQGAIYGAAIGGAIPAVGAAVGSAVKGTRNAATGAVARGGEELIDAADNMKSGASGLYQQMRDKGALLNPSSSNGLLATIDAEIRKSKFIPALNPKTTGIIDDLADTIRASKGQIGIDDLDQYRRMLGRIGQTEDGVSAGAARRAIDDFVNSLDNKGLVNGGEEAIGLLNKGRAEYARAARFENIADILNKADGDPNKIKSALTRFMNNDRNMRGWNEAEKAALREAARGTTAEKVLKSLGKFGFDLGNSTTMGNTIGPVLGGAVGVSTAGATGGLVPVAGTVARQGQKYLARGKAENLLRTIEGNAPKKLSNPIKIKPPAGVAGQIGSETQAPMVAPRPRLSDPIPSRRSENFDNAVNFVMDIEGGYVADDAGAGPTNMGINSRANPDLKIKDLTTADAKNTYKTRYWNAINGDSLPPEIALIGFDAAVNHGPGKAKQLIQQAGGDPRKLLRLREMEYVRLVKSNPKKYAQYAQGWISRLKKLESALA
jgi:hypothetical protein